MSTAPEGFPRGDLDYTNQKVIVARSYVASLPRPDFDQSAADRIGHGTAIGMAAAGVVNAGPLATLSATSRPSRAPPRLSSKSILAPC